MDEVAAWLRGLGLAKYVKDFEDNEIDFDALPHLTESMLEQIGLPIGPRAKLLAAIAELAASTATAQQNKRDERAIAETPAVARLLAAARREWPVRVEKDFSFGSRAYAGDRWVLVGDAGSFLDPVFSTVTPRGVTTNAVRGRPI